MTDKELQTMSWDLLLEKLVEFLSLQQIRSVRDLSVHAVVMRLMRKENYLIGMLNKGILAFPVFGWVPGTGPHTGAASSKGVEHRFMLPKTLEWTLNWCILQNMFDRYLKNLFIMLLSIVIFPIL